MFESIQNVWLKLRGMNFYVEVTAAAFAAYFFLRYMMEIDVKKAVWVPLGVALLGQFAYGLQDAAAKSQKFGLDDIIMALFMAALQAGLASMIYTMSEKNGWIDKLGAMLGKKIDKDPTP